VLSMTRISHRSAKISDSPNRIVGGSGASRPAVGPIGSSAQEDHEKH
jgi:hypothetical protein